MSDQDLGRWPCEPREKTACLLCHGNRHVSCHPLSPPADQRCRSNSVVHYLPKMVRRNEKKHKTEESKSIKIYPLGFYRAGPRRCVRATLDWRHANRPWDSSTEICASCRNLWLLTFPFASARGHPSHSPTSVCLAGSHPIRPWGGRQTSIQKYILAWPAPREEEWHWGIEHIIIITNKSLRSQLAGLVICPGTAW